MSKKNQNADMQIKTMKKNIARTSQKVVLSENKSAKYRIVKIQQSSVVRQKMVDTASSAVQTQKPDENMAENIQKAANISGQKKNSSTSKHLNRTTTSDNTDDKYK